MTRSADPRGTPLDAARLAWRRHSSPIASRRGTAVRPDDPLEYVERPANLAEAMDTPHRATGVGAATQLPRNIEFPDGSPWAAYSDDWALSMALSNEVPPPLRVMFAAMSRVNPTSGVAVFHSGELREILGRDEVAASAPAVSNALSRAKASGWVLDDSTSRRVLLSPAHIQRGPGGEGGITPAVPFVRGSGERFTSE